MTITLTYPPYPAGLVDIPGSTLTVNLVELPPLPNLSPPQNLIVAMVALPRDPATGNTVPVTAATKGFGTSSIDRLDLSGPDFRDFSHVYFPPLLAEGFNFETQEFGDTDPALETGGGKAGAGVGDITLMDPAGDLDDPFSGMNWDACRITIRRGRPDPIPVPNDGDPFVGWQNVAELTSDRVLYGMVEKRIRIKDRQATLYETALLDKTYDGTGGINGDAALKGQPRPQAYGRVFNVEPKQINAAKLIYQWHDRKVDGPAAIRDGINAYTIDGDDVTYSSLDAASIAVGHARTCNELGLIRLGSTPALSLRLDGKGDAAPIYIESAFTGYQETRTSILRRIAMSRGSHPLVDGFAGGPLDVDRPSFFRMEGLQPAPVGFWFRDATTIGAAFDAIMGGCAGLWRIPLNGLLSVDQLMLPVLADFAIDCTGDLKAHPEMVACAVPRWKSRVGWRHNWLPQSKNELGAATSSQQQLYGEEWTYEPWSEPQVQARHPMARDVEVPGNYAFQADALAEAIRQQQLFGVRRERWRLNVRLDPFADVLGKTVDIQNFDRYGLGSRLMRVVGVQAVAGLADVTLDVWG